MLLGRVRAFLDHAKLSTTTRIAVHGSRHVVCARFPKAGNLASALARVKEQTLEEEKGSLMAMIECHGCLEKFDEHEIRWIKPFGGGAVQDKDGVLSLIPAEFDHPEPGAMPYCPVCRAARI